MILLNCGTIEYCKELNKSVMNKSACSTVICQPGGHEQKHDSIVWNEIKLVNMINFHNIFNNHYLCVVVAIVMVDNWLTWH